MSLFTKQLSIFGLFLMSALPAQAAYMDIAIQDHMTTSLPALRTVRFSPCSSWRYDTTARGYVCGFTGISETVPDFYSVDSALRQLDRRVEELEATIQFLQQQIEDLKKQ